MTRVFMNLPALPDRAAVVAECERLGALRAASYRAHDGIRCMAEVKEVSIPPVHIRRPRCFPLVSAGGNG